MRRIQQAQPASPPAGHPRRANGKHRANVTEGRPSVAEERRDVDELDLRMQELFAALRAWRLVVKGDGPLVQAWDAYESALSAVVDRDELEAALADQVARPGETIPPSRP